MKAFYGWSKDGKLLMADVQVKTSKQERTDWGTWIVVTITLLAVVAFCLYAAIKWVPISY